MGRDESPSRAPLTLRVITTPPAPFRAMAAASATADPPSDAPAEAPEPAPMPAPPVPPRAAGPSGVPTAPTMPTRDLAPPRGLPYGRVVAVFVGSFALTTVAVLGTWFGVVRTGRPVVELAPVPAPIVVMAPAPIAAVVEPTPDEPVVADATDEPLDAEPLVEPVAARPAPPRAAPAPRRPTPTVVVMETPRPEVVAEPTRAPEPAPPAPTVPEAAARHAGTYVGRVQTRPMTVDLAFRPEGKLSATIRVNDGDATEEIKANGTWTLTEGGVTVALVESGADAPRVWSAQVADGEIDGRVVEDPRTTRRFHGSR